VIYHTHARQKAHAIDDGHECLNANGAGILTGLNIGWTQRRL
jgi:hypothetical protein